VRAGMLQLLSPTRQEALRDPVIERRVGLPPLLWIEPEPEFEDIGTPVADVGHAAVPPTVRPSTSNVGCPTPAGTLCPPLPQMPMPSSSSRSLPIPLTLVSTVGPSPISVAPWTGSAILPLRMR